MLDAANGDFEMEWDAVGVVWNDSLDSPGTEKEHVSGIAKSLSATAKLVADSRLNEGKLDSRSARAGGISNSDMCAYEYLP